MIFVGGDPASTGGGAVVEGIYSCAPAVSVGDAVYISAPGTCARAIATSTATAPAIGLVSAKSDPNNCTVRYFGELGGFGGLLADVDYYLSDVIVGGLSTVQPVGNGKVVQYMTRAKDASTHVIKPGSAFVIMRS